MLASQYALAVDAVAVALASKSVVLELKYTDPVLPFTAISLAGPAYLLAMPLKGIPLI